MKRFYCITLLFIAGLSFLTGCKKETPEEKFINKIKEVTTQYVYSELDSIKCDSVVIGKIDTVTALDYAKINLELIENMHENYQEQYLQATLMNDVEQQNYLEMYLSDVRQHEDFFRSIVDNESTDEKALLLYMINASYFLDGQQSDIIYLMNPDFTPHVLDPFGNNLLESTDDYEN